MKSRPTAHRLTFTLAALLGLGASFSSGTARATTYTWVGGGGLKSGGGSTNWGDSGNWLGSTVPPSDLANTDLVFGNTSYVSSTLDTAYSIHSLTFSSGASGYTFGGQSLTLGAGGLSQSATNAETFSTAPVILGANQTWTLGTNAGALNLNAGLNLSGWTLTINAEPPYVDPNTGKTGTVNTISGAISGTGSLNKTGTGTLVLAGASTYTGGTTVSQGTLALGTGGSITGGDISVQGGAALSISGTGSVSQGTSNYLIIDGTSTIAANGFMTGGSLSAGTVAIGDSGIGIFTQSGGIFTTNGKSLNIMSASSGYNLSGTGSLSTGYVIVGGDGSAGTFTQSGGTFTTNHNTLYLGFEAGGTGTYTLSGGTLTTSVTQVSDDANTCNFTQTAGLHTTGTLDLTGCSTSSQGTYNLNGGTLNVGIVTSGDRGVEGTSTFNFNGGTLQAGANSTNFMQGLSTAYVLPGGAFIDTNGFAVTIAQNLLDGSASKLNDVHGALTVLGTGTLTLIGTNTYTGGTNFNGGVLNAGSAGALGTSGMLTFTGGTLQFSSSNTTDYSSRFNGTGNQAISLDTNGQNVTLASGISGSGTSLTKLGAGTLTLTGTNTYTGNTNVQAGTLTELNNGSALSTGTVKIASGASVALSNTSSGAIYQAGASTFTGAGTIQKTGAGQISFGGNGGTVAIALSPGGLIDVEGGTLVGSSSNQASYANNQGSLNIASGAAFNGFEGTIRVDALTGAGTLAGGDNGGSTTIGVAGGSGTFSGVIQDNTGSGALLLIKAGTGTQILTGANTYTGATTVSAGTLQIGAGGTTGSLSTSSTITDNATLAFDRSNNVFQGSDFSAATISGMGGLVQMGSKILVLNTANTYTGGTTFAAGSLEVDVAGALGTTGTLSFTGGTLRYGSSNNTDYSGRFSTAANQAISIDTDGRNVTFANGLTSSGGSLTKLGDGTLTLTGTNNYTSDTNVDTGTLAITAGTTGVTNSTANFTVDTSTGSTAAGVLSGNAVLNTGTEYLGTTHHATFTQSGTSTNTVGGTLFLGFPGGGSSNTSGVGTYNLQGGALNSGSTQIGNYGEGALYQTGGTQTVGYLYSGVNGGYGTYSLSAGTLQSGTVYVGYSGNGSAAGVGNFNQSGGTQTVSNALVIGVYSGGRGNYVLGGSSGTPQLSSARIYVGGSGTGVFTQTGGTNTVTGNDASTNQIYLGNGSGSSGTYNLQGGALSTPSIDVGDAGAGTLTLTGGTAAVTTTVDIAYNAGGTGTVNLNTGGTLQVGSGVLGYSGTSTFNFNGGTLQAGASSPTFMQSLSAANVDSGGATIDTNGFSVTVSQALLNGVSGADGGLTKNGLGTLTFTGANNYTGLTTINAGTLLVNGVQSGTGLVTVQNSGSVLGGTGNLAAAVSVTASGTLNPGSNLGAAGSITNVGKLTVGALTFSSMGVAVFDVSSGTSYDQVLANGNVTLGGANLTLNVPANATFTTGQTLDLIHSTGTLSGTFAGVANNGEYTYGGETFQALYTSTDFELTALASVPEPTTWLGGALLCTIALGHSWRHRRRTRQV